MSKKVKCCEEMKALLLKDYGKERADRIISDFNKRFEQLCLENKDEIKEVKEHTVQKIYPAVSMYRAMQQDGISKDDAFEFIARYFYMGAEKEKESMRRLLKIPFAYKLLPFMWKKITVSMFGTSAGFRFKFYDAGNSEVKFDMLKCPYFENFTKYGCPELTKILCHTDDIKNTGIHPRVIWNRTKTLGDGGDLCDFNLIIK